MTGLKGFNQDDVSFEMKCEPDVAVVIAGADGEPAHGISVKFTNRLEDYVKFVWCLGGTFLESWDTDRFGLDGVDFCLVYRTPWQVCVIWTLRFSLVVGW